MQIDEHESRALMLHGVVYPDRGLRRERAAYAAMRQETGRGLQPEQAVESVSGRGIRGQDADVSMPRERLGNQPCGNRERIHYVSVKINRGHVRVRDGESVDQPGDSCARSQVVNNGTGRPVAPFSLPSFQATPAISRCAQSYFLVNFDRKHAAVMLPPGRPAILAKSAKLLASPSW